jgi:hypothetical protein
MAWHDAAESFYFGALVAYRPRCVGGLAGDETVKVKVVHIPRSASGRHASGYFMPSKLK